MILHRGKLACRYITNSILKESIRYKRTNARRKQLEPGIGLQTKLFTDKQSAELDTLDFDELEADFSKLGLTHKKHVDQIEMLKEREKYLIVKQKYFRVKMPNFLTWSDKQQIRYLHKTNPEEWTIEKLSEGFPALPETIAKIAKSDWTKKNITKVRNHDTSVKTNWVKFNEEKIDLPPDLKAHLQKFTNRQLSFEPFEIPADALSKPHVQPIDGEFSQIIASYERIKNKTSNLGPEVQIEDSSSKQLHNKRKRENYVIDAENLEDRRRVTLTQLHRKLEKDVLLGKEIQEEDKMLLRQLEENNKLTEIKSENPIVDITQSEGGKTGYLYDKIRTKKDYSHLEYPEKITIPKDKLKLGYTYKLNDCYYESDGLFLYRVPGMIK